MSKFSENSHEDDQNRQRPFDHPIFGGVKVRIQIMTLVGRIARYLVSITALTLILVMLTYVLGLINF